MAPQKDFARKLNFAEDKNEGKSKVDSEGEVIENEINYYDLNDPFLDDEQLVSAKNVIVS